MKIFIFVPAGRPNEAGGIETVLVTDIMRDIRITAARHQMQLLLLLGRMPDGN